MQNPIMINRGSRIVSTGEVITEDVFEILRSLGLIDMEGIDWPVLGGQALLVTIVLVILASSTLKILPPSYLSSTAKAWLFYSLLHPHCSGCLFGPGLPARPPVYFTAVVVSAYFGHQTAVVVSQPKS